MAHQKYENYMQYIKRKVRSGRNPAVQIVKRLFEETQHEEEYPTIFYGNVFMMLYIYICYNKTYFKNVFTMFSRANILI